MKVDVVSRSGGDEILEELVSVVERGRNSFRIAQKAHDPL
jgi:hypothetical protein